MIYNDSSFGIKYFSNIEQRFTDETNEIRGQAHKHIIAMAVSLRSLKKACYISVFSRTYGAYYTTITPFAKEF